MPKKPSKKEPKQNDILKKKTKRKNKFFEILD
jgi:hypothetical protein